MQLTLRDGLLLVPVAVGYLGREIVVPDVVVDTGSATTLISADVVAPVGIVPELNDVLHVVRGVGGAEVVFSRRVQSFAVGERSIYGFEIEVGAIDAAFDINGILGMDFLLGAAAIINLRTLELLFASELVPAHSLSTNLHSRFLFDEPAALAYTVRSPVVGIGAALV